MDRSNAHRWATLCFFLPSSLALAYFVFYLTTFTPTFADAGSATLLTTGETPQTGNILLARDRTTTMDQIQLTYRGLDAGSVVIDITLLDLDPEYAYRRTIPEKDAKTGFWLDQKQFRLLSANPSRLKIVRTRG